MYMSKNLLLTLGVIALSTNSAKAAETCQTAEPGSQCYTNVMWAKNTGIHQHPDWYPGLSQSSSLLDFQNALFQKNEHGCPKPCEDQPGPPPPPLPLLPLSERPLEFAAVGDWGFHSPIYSHNGFRNRRTQEAVAASMGDRYQYSNQNGPDFILNNGDSFYSRGVTSNTDDFWRTTWYDVYSKHNLTAKPWFSIMGNHDYQHTACGCADPYDPAPKECAQINPDLSHLGSDVNWVYKAKSFSDDRYLKSHKVMVVNVDTNYIDPSTCEYSDFGGCTKDICRSKVGGMQKAAEDFFKTFLASDAVKNAKTIVINSHYPWPYETWLGSHNERADWAQRLIPFKNMIVEFANTNKDKNLLFFAGHTHKIEETKRVGNLRTWITGGGGGYHSEGNQGWYKVQVETNGDYKVTPKVVGVVY